MRQKKKKINKINRGGDEGMGAFYPPGSHKLGLAFAFCYMIEHQWKIYISDDVTCLCF